MAGFTLGGDTHVTGQGGFEVLHMAEAAILRQPAEHAIDVALVAIHEPMRAR